MTRSDLDDISLGDVEDDGSYPGGRTSTAPADGVDVPRGTRVDAKPRFDDELVGLFQRRVRLDRMAWDCTVGGLAVFIVATVVAMYALASPSAWFDVVSLYAAAVALLATARALKEKADEALMEFDRAARDRGYAGAADFTL